MARPKNKESKAINIKMDLAVANQLEQYCQETGLSKTVAIERILKQFFDKKVVKNK